MEKAQAWLRAEMEAAGFRCWTAPSRPDRCSVLLGLWGEGNPGKPVVFAGHIDTVHPKGSFGKDDPFYIEDGKAYGPGVLDMKGGIIIALYVVKALASLGYDERPIKFLFAGEEEGDHVDTDVDLLFTEECKGALCAFNMETGHITNSPVSYTHLPGPPAGFGRPAVPAPCPPQGAAGAGLVLFGLHPGGDEMCIRDRCSTSRW